MSSGTDEVTFESFPNRKQEKAESGMEAQWLGRFFFFSCLARLWSEELIYTLGQNPRKKEFVKLLGRKRILVAWVLLGVTEGLLRKCETPRIV